MNRNQSVMRRIAKVLALVLALAMIASSAFYLLMLVGGTRYASAIYAYAAEEEEADDKLAFSAEDQFRIDLIPELLQFIKDSFRDTIEYETMLDGMYQGLMDSLDDPWSEYYFAGDSKADYLTVTLDNQFYGVGISFTLYAEGFKVMSFVEGSPAQEAGIPLGSYLVSVDGEGVEGLDATQLAMKIRGEEGTPVTLGIKIGDRVTEYTMIRRRVFTSSLEYKMLDDSIGYIRLDSFSSTTGEEFSAARLALLNQNMNGLIIDLRGNGGGYLEQAWEIADQLTDSCVLGYYFQSGEIYRTIRSYNNKTRKVPVILLVNESTASASEALTAALKENGAAIVVGEVTYGKGAAQGQYSIKNGDSIKLSVLTFTGPSKQSFHGKGIVPDYLVYTYGGYSSTEAVEMVNGMVPLSDGERAYAGDMSLNVLAAQQRLKVLGYDVEANAIMDSRTMDALRQVQKRAGSYSYGNLDCFTIKALNEQFNALLGFDKEGNLADTQLQKAIDVLKENMMEAPAEQKAAD
ncbi:MAG: PDZ domain-containing protein [Firmicutes bacterium]|nr:PDZ domain-containing protein [Bacillota bacterium]